MPALGKHVGRCGTVLFPTGTWTYGSAGKRQYNISSQGVYTEQLKSGTILQGQLEHHSSCRWWVQPAPGKHMAFSLCEEHWMH